MPASARQRYVMFRTLAAKAFGAEHRELRRLRKEGRYLPGAASLLGNVIRYNDALTLRADYLDIFKREIYRFKSTSSRPRIIDGGANIGMSTIYFKRLYPEASVIAFEPDPVLFGMLKSNTSRFCCQDVELRNEALSAHDGVEHFWQEGAHSGRTMAVDGKDGVLKVPARSLEGFLSEHVEFLKLDIEGAECDVIRPCWRLLENVEFIFIEYHSLRNKVQELDTLLSWLTGTGHRYHIHEAWVRRHPYMQTTTMHDMDMQLNIYAYRA